MTRFKVRACGLLLILSWPVVAFAQGGAAGSITGYVFDQSGMPLPGVKVTASSPTQIGGAKSAYTNGEGFFRMAALFPGRFEVRTTAPKLKTAVQQNVVVGLTSATEVNMVMEVESSKVEEVKIINKSPVVSTTTPNVKEKYELEFVESLPMTARDQVHTQMINEVAGANNGRMRGGAAGQTLFTQDGFELNATNGTYPVLKSSAAFEVNTAGYGADAPTSPGGMINLVTKSGSNKTEFELNVTADSEKLRFFYDERDAPPQAIGAQGAGASSYYILAPLLAGPLIKDKLWYFVTDEFHFIERTRTADPEGILGDRLPYEKFIHKGTLKLTWQVSTRNKLSSLTNLEFPITEQNQRQELGVPLEAQRWRVGRRMFTGLIWESLLQDNLVLRAQAGVISIWSHVYPYQCRQDPDTCDQIPSVRNTFPREQFYGNDNQHTRDDLFSVQTLTALDWYPGSRWAGEHSVSLRHRLYTEAAATYRSVPGDQVTELGGTVPVAQTTYYSNDPRSEAGRQGWFISQGNQVKHTATVSDSWKPTRHLTVIPSLSYVRVQASNTGSDGVISNATWVPGIATAWDATRDGRTVVRASVSSYVDADYALVARNTVGTQPQKRCLWDPVEQSYTAQCTFSGGAATSTFGSPCGPSGYNPDGTLCTQALTMPRTTELTLGSEREVVQGVALSLDLVYRKFSHQFDRRETNRIWNDAGSELARNGSFRNGRAETITDMSTPNDAWRRYRGITVGLDKREGRFKSHVSYTLSDLTGTQQDINNLYGDIPGRDVYLAGDLPDDHRHEVKWTLSWQATPWLSFGGRYKYLSGTPYSRLFYNPVTNVWDQYKARTGVNPGLDINDPADDRDLRLPDRHDMNLQVRFNLLPIIGQRLDLYVDVLNLLALRTATNVGQEDQRNFGVETGWLDPFRIRLGLNYRY